MDGLHGISCLIGGAFLANAIPHLVSGMTGRAFQTPFATPSGRGLSSSTVNVLWAAANLAAAYGLLVRLAGFELASGRDVAAAGLGGLAVALFSAWAFGRFHGGNPPSRT